jgi:H/ACA ribonucleoprotein complex subunit 3
MVKDVYVQGARLKLPARSLIGKGGEADVYQLDERTVLKRYKESGDPDYQGNPAAQLGARQRLVEQQTKLTAFPTGLPDRVITPIDLAYDKATAGKIVGYTMRYLQAMEVLLSYGNRQYREQGGIDGNRVIDIFRDLHQVVQGIHKAGVVIGDFNDLNVLVDSNDQTYLVDADSMQFGSFPCRTFTSRFVDPLNCGKTGLVLARPHNEDSDWYAFLIMLVQSLLYVGPYGGVHKPASGKRLQHDERVLQRRTFFDAGVVYPKPALPLDILPDQFLEHLHQVFEHDRRGEFPRTLLDNVRWTHCLGCGTLHARATCPICAAPGAIKQTLVIRGTVTATRLFQTTGRILYATHQNGKLRYLYHEADSFRREGDKQVLTGTLDPELRYRIQGDKTLLGKRDKLFVLSTGTSPQRQTTDTVGNLSVFDANDSHHYWIQNGQLVRDGHYGSEYIGDVLTGQTLFWVGKRFGFGFYRAGHLLRAFTFDAHQRGINDQVAIANLPGQLVDATTVFGDNRAWFMATLQEAGQLVNRCHVLDSRGTVLATTEAIQGDNSWLAAGIRGHLAIGDVLYAATDDGIVRVGLDNGTVTVERSFPDTEPFVSSATQLVPSPEGIYAVSSQEITLLKIR